MKSIKFGILEYILLVIMAIIGIAMICCSIGLTKYPYAQSEIHKNYDTIFVENSKRILAELQNIKATQGFDSIVSTVAANQLVIIKRQDDLINDIRQETNNNLDKTNSLISFWVGIMALLGVFVPIILQFKIHHVAKSDIDKIKSEAETKVNEAEVKINDQIAKFDEWANKTKRNIDILHYTNELSSIYLSAQYRLSTEFSSRKEVFRLLWQQSNDNFAIIIDNLFKSPDTDQNRGQLMECLIHVSATLRLISSEISRNRNRSVMNANDMVRKIINIVHTRDYVNWETLHETFESLLRQLRSLTFKD